MNTCETPHIGSRHATVLHTYMKCFQRDDKIREATHRLVRAKVSARKDLDARNFGFAKTCTRLRKVASRKFVLATKDCDLKGFCARKFVRAKVTARENLCTKLLLIMN